MHDDFIIKNLTKVYSNRRPWRFSWRQIFRFDNAKLEQKIRKQTRALDSISCSFNKGDIIGVIGKNGAGKSSFLKLLSGISPITEGSISGSGFVFPMLESNAAFNKNLTVTENIRLVSLLVRGSKNIEGTLIESVLEDAGLDDYADSPLSTLSSGMAARLTTCIALNIGASLILIDEIISNVDLETQMSLLSKLREKARAKQCAILIVSHDLKLINEFCDKAMVFDKGQVVFNGKTNPAIKFYAKDSSSKFLLEKSNSNSIIETAAGKISDIQLSCDGMINSAIRSNSESEILVEFTKSIQIEKIQFNFDIWFDQVLLSSYRQPAVKVDSKKEVVKAIFKLNALPLTMKEVDISVSVMVLSRAHSLEPFAHKCWINGVKILQNHEADTEKVEFIVKPKFSGLVSICEVKSVEFF